MRQENTLWHGKDIVYILAICAALGILIFGFSIGHNLSSSQSLYESTPESKTQITKENIDTREYTDVELQEMLTMSAEELQTKINTLTDAVAFLDIRFPDIWHSFHIWIGEGSEAAILRSGKGILDDTVETDVGGRIAGRSDIVTVIAYLLSDNYDIGGLYGFSYNSEGFFDPITSASYIVMNDEYIVFDPVLGMTGDMDSRWHLLPEKTVNSLHEYVNEIAPSGILNELYSIYVIEDGQGITFRDKDTWVIVLEPAVDPLYTNEIKKPVSE